MLIAIPSKGRAGLVKSCKILVNAVLYVTKGEYHQYINLYKNVIAIPNNIIGITATRNWILKNTQERWVVFIDDDVKNAGWIKLLERKTKHIGEKKESFWINEFKKAFQICEQLNYKIWGVKTESASRSVYPYSPIRLRRYVTASCMGIINDGEYYFDESFPVKEDYEICLRHIKNKGGIFGIDYLYWENEHWGKDGGCKDYRTQKMEKDCIKKLIKMYPGMIRSVKRKANK